MIFGLLWCFRTSYFWANIIYLDFPNSVEENRLSFIWRGIGNTCCPNQCFEWNFHFCRTWTQLWGWKWNLKSNIAVEKQNNLWTLRFSTLDVKFVAISPHSDAFGFCFLCGKKSENRAICENLSGKVNWDTCRNLMSEINKGFSLWTSSKFFMNGCCSCFNSHFDHHGRFVHFWGAQIILAISLSGNLWAKRCWTKKTLLGPRGPSTRNWPSTLKEILPAAPRCILKVTGGQDRCQNDSFVTLCLASISVCDTSLNKFQSH